MDVMWTSGGGIYIARLENPTIQGNFTSISTPKMADFKARKER